MQKSRCNYSKCECNKQQLQIKWNTESLNGCKNIRFIEGGYNPVEILKADTKNCISLCSLRDVNIYSILKALYNDNSFDETLLTLLLEYPEFYSRKYSFVFREEVSFETFYFIIANEDVNNIFLNDKQKIILSTLADIIRFKYCFISKQNIDQSADKIFDSFVNSKLISIKAIKAAEEYFTSKKLVSSDNTCFVDAIAAKNKQKDAEVKRAKKFSDVVFKF